MLPRGRRPFDVGIAGYGYAAKTLHAPLIHSVPGLRLAAVSTSDPAKLHADWPDVPALPDAQALFARPDIDLVVIPTPNDTHFPLTLQALEAAKHVVVEKPFTLTLAEARTLHARAQAVGRMLSVFHNRRWDADFLTLRRIVAAGELGRIVHFESHFDRYRPQVRARWRERALPGGGLWYDLGPHLLDQALQLFGLPEAIALDTAVQRDGGETDDWFHAVLRYGDLRAILHAGTLVARPAPRFTVHGTKGSLVKAGLDPQEEALKAGLRPPAPDWGLDPLDCELAVWMNDRLESRRIACERGDYPAFYASVRDALRDGAPNPVSAEQAMQVMALLELGRKSAAERREMAV